MRARILSEPDCSGRWKCGATAGCLHAPSNSSVRSSGYKLEPGLPAKGAGSPGAHVGPYRSFCRVRSKKNETRCFEFNTWSPLALNLLFGEIVLPAEV